MREDVERPPLDSASLRSRLLVVGSPWRHVDVVDETGSTNADLIARAASGQDVDGSVLIAENQVAGRGRNGRTWSVIPGAQLVMSAGVGTDGIPAQAWGWIPLLCGLAVLDAVAPSGVDVGLKWPNDVLTRPPAVGKLAGILAEVASPASVIVVGVGLNVSLRAGELSDPGATSLAMLGAGAVDRTDLAVALLDGLARRVARLRARSGVDEDLVAEYTARSLTLGARVRAMLPGGREIVGEARSIDAQGRLCIDTGAEIAVVSAGDVVHLRPLSAPSPE